ncbi:sensor histidine kinase [Cystobacter ferrugineus]|uniref:histidine kinase n=1 Tax=Cystobacter ferrugineus TaxID=83449 RepID=A0A1L9B1Y6_9BACT|nr:ATP-binding protein [Cystobacter ferrugineus]OJH36193.1 PAS domain-containing sensor histidine kinase [Cystobacter ferrugineus]
MSGDHSRRWMDALAEPLVACDADERVRYLNPAAERLLGWCAGQLVGQPFSRLLSEHPETSAERAFLHALLAKNPGGQPARTVLQRRDGSRQEVDMTVGCSGQEREEYISVLVRRPAEISGTAGERAHQLVFDNAPLGLFHFDAASTLLACNDYLASIIGAARPRIIGLRLLSLPDKPLADCVRDVLNGRHAYYEGDYHSTTLDKVTPVRVHLAPCIGEHGEVEGGVGIVEDITEQRHAEMERTRLLREAQEAIRVRDDFLTIASHELKTPLTPLSLRLAGLERRLERQEPVDPALLRHARQHLLRLTALINDLLDASRIEAGRLALHFEPTRMDSLVERVLTSMEAQRDQHLIDYSHPEEPVRIRGDTFRLEQVIANLLENALKYSPHTSTVRVALEVRGDFALLTVSDEGIGIPKDQQEQLFERYFRARNVSISSYGGLGLGLYISRDIVERHGGRIWVESELGRGSTFYVALPLLSAVNPTPPEPHALSQHVH